MTSIDNALSFDEAFSELVSMSEFSLEGRKLASDFINVFGNTGDLLTIHCPEVATSGAVDDRIFYKASDRFADFLITARAKLGHGSVVEINAHGDSLSV